MRNTSRIKISSLRFLIRSFFAVLALIVFSSSLAASTQSSSLTVTIDKAKVERGESIAITVHATGREDVRALVLRPTSGGLPLELRRKGSDEFTAIVEIGNDSPDGLYVIHAWSGDTSKPSAVGKASFRVGNIVADFFIANLLDREKPAADVDAYLKDFRLVGGNFLIAHNLIVQTGAFYPSKITATTAGNDLVELVLDRADRAGVAVLLSVGWDMTRNTPYKGRMSEIKSIAAELFAMYRHHPSLAGFYSWQEGSGTYYATFVREFSEHIKKLNPGLLTACAPHIDDALLASYLSIIEDLDIMIYQSAVMASYRPDNRKQYPLRRVRDFSGLGAGAKRVQNKIVLTHVELFAYMEKRLKPDILTASYNDIYGQILSAATVTDTDGIALFAYHAHIYEQSKRFEAGKEGQRAVENGLKMYQTITIEVSKESNPLALYIPYSDFVIERWNNYFLPALDAFRKLGIPIDILPYAPPLAESVYPYYPIHMNETVLKRLLEERTVLVLANVSGFQQTDSDLIKAFVEAGGVVVAFGSQIPFGRTFERKDLFGGESLPEKIHTRIAPTPHAAGEIKLSVTFARTRLPTWKPGTAKVVATYEDGTAAVLMNKFGKGTAFAILPDATFSSKHLPGLVRDVFNKALTTTENRPLTEIIGSDTSIDLALRRKDGQLSVAIANHNPSQRQVSIRFQRAKQGCSIQIGVAQVVFPSLNSRTNLIDLTIPKNEVAVLRCKQ
ncbi:MAG: DUF4434 domain-containing protein [Pyrinomonadaceae bacterium]